MKSFPLMMAIAAMCAVATDGASQTAGVAETPQPQWVKVPSATLDPLSWPERALRLDVDGEATLKCQYDAKGLLGLCNVVSETPKGFAFGIAALRMAPAFKLQAKMSDGSPLVPGEITFSVKFVAADFRDPRSRRR